MYFNVTSSGYTVTSHGYIGCIYDAWKEGTMAQRYLGQFDARTGEVLEEGFVAYIAPKRQNGFGTRWMAMAEDAAMLLAKSNLGANDFKVIMGLIAKLDFENLLVLNQAELARELNMRRQHVGRSVKRLIAMGALLEGPRIG